jgi:hypothetical protein
MFYEYALEPAAVTSWEAARYFLDAFGPWKGRFLAQYPKDWVRLLLSGLTCKEMEKKRITARLELAKKNRVFYRRLGTTYDGTQAWIDNARQEHARQAFRAIIACAASAEDYVLEASSLDESHARWQVDSGRLLSREPAVFVQALELLLTASSKVVIVDPYFRADQSDKTGPLTAFCNLIRGRINEVQVHFGPKFGYAFCMQHAERALPSSVPAGMKVSLHCWTERAGGPRIHNRYLLTDVGGVQFGDSIEEGDPGQHDRVSILEEVTRARLWDEFVGPTPAFDSGGAPRTFEGRRGGGQR